MHVLFLKKVSGVYLSQKMKCIEIYRWVGSFRFDSLQMSVNVLQSTRWYRMHETFIGDLEVINEAVAVFILSSESDARDEAS
jgi:hypothetical protein